ncbi:MAG: hypothetical protein ABW170_02835 [Candidatus Thiodiazotropha sp. L084R]
MIDEYHGGSNSRPAILSSMCITIPSSANVGHSRSIPAWVWLTETPVRLLTAAGLISLMLWSLQLFLMQSQSWNWMIFNLVFAVLPASAFGVVLSYMPLWLKVTPLRYVNYGMLFILILASQLVFHLSIYFGESPGLFYLSLLLIVWAVCLKFVKNFLASSFQRHRLFEQGVFAALLMGGALGVLLTVLSLTERLEGQHYYWLAGLFYLLPLVIFLLNRAIRDTQRIP